MRLWHKDLIPVLPQKQLVSQWRECCCIAKNIATKGTPNHLLVNKVLDYPISDFAKYCNLVVNEITKRGFRISSTSLKQLNANISDIAEQRGDEIKHNIFDKWHNYRYFMQCYYNLQEKYDCGGISEEEWIKIEGVKKEKIERELLKNYLV